MAKSPTTSIPSMRPTFAPTNGSVVVAPRTDCVADDKAEFDRTSWIIAVTLAIFAAFINNLGLNLQKLAWTKAQSAVISAHVYRAYWVTGMVLVVLASIFDFVALAFGPQSVIAPLGALTMVSNAIAAPWMHGEKLHKQVLIATFVIMIGCAISVGAASHTNNICDIDSLFALYLTGRFALYALILLSVIGGMLWFIKRAERMKTEYGADSEEYMKVFRYHRISYAGLSGIFGSQSVLFARSVSQMFVGSARGGRIFLAYPGTYLVVTCLVACIVLQIYWLNQGLARFESLYNVPIFTSTWIVGTALGGGIFYGEFSSFSALQAFLFPLGVFLCIIGVFFLSRGTADDGNHVISPEGLVVEEFQSPPSSDDANVDDDIKAVSPPPSNNSNNNNGNGIGAKKRSTGDMPKRMASPNTTASSPVPSAATATVEPETDLFGDEEMVVSPPPASTISKKPNNKRDKELGLV